MFVFKFVIDHEVPFDHSSCSFNFKVMYDIGGWNLTTRSKLYFIMCENITLRHQVQGDMLWYIVFMSYHWLLSLFLFFFSKQICLNTYLLKAFLRIAIQNVMLILETLCAIVFYVRV